MRLAAAALWSVVGFGSGACNLMSGGGGDRGDAGAEKAGAPTKLAAKATEASDTGPGNSAAANATDGDLSTQWSAGGAAPQWIQLDLGAPTAVSKVRLAVSQTPAGPTVHQVHGGPTPEEMVLIGTLEGGTADNQWLELAATASNVRYLRLATVKSPSWVAWREIEVYR